MWAVVSRCKPLGIAAKPTQTIYSANNIKDRGKKNLLFMGSSCSWELLHCQRQLVSCQSSKEGRKGVFSLFVISWFYIPWKVSLENYSSWLVIWRFCMTCEESEILTDTRDLTTLFYVYVIVRRKSSEWLETSIESELSKWLAIWIRGLSHSRFCFLQTLFLV